MSQLSYLFWILVINVMFKKDDELYKMFILLYDYIVLLQIRKLTLC